MHRHHSFFVNGIEKKRKIELTFVNTTGNQEVKICVPIDYYPCRRVRDKCEYYYFWDPSAEEGGRLFRLAPEEIVSIILSVDAFGPAGLPGFWKKKWFIGRNWGHFGYGEGFWNGLLSFVERRCKRQADRRRHLPRESKECKR